MILRCGLLLLLFFDYGRTTEDIYSYRSTGSSVKELDKRFSYWPSVHNGARLMKLRKREFKEPQVGHSEGGKVEVNNQDQQPASPQSPGPAVAVTDTKNQSHNVVNSDLPKANTTVNAANETVVNSTVTNKNDTKINVTVAAKSTPDQLDLNNPGALKRGVIVFGGFALLAVAYFIFYRRKGSKNDANNTHSTNDANQFRYGVLKSEDRQDNLESSRIPLTMESDDDDEDDVEIFDLGQKKKSLSYVNLQMHDEDIVLNTSDNAEHDKDDNLLVDIEDKASVTLINWSSNSNKSIL